MIIIIIIAVSRLPFLSGFISFLNLIQALFKQFKIYSTVPLWSSGPSSWLYCVSCEVQTEFINVKYKKVDLLCGLVVRVIG
jgi:hypothetical protein